MCGMRLTDSEIGPHFFSPLGRETQASLHNFPLLSTKHSSIHKNHPQYIIASTQLWKSKQRHRSRTKQLIWAPSKSPDLSLQWRGQRQHKYPSGAVGVPRPPSITLRYTDLHVHNNKLRSGARTDRWSGKRELSKKLPDPLRRSGSTSENRSAICLEVTATFRYRPERHSLM